ncbi:MAG: CotH kinase family protein [Paludibacteraceae bacterium]|nr:CotH kinase family protein [Paludibacteraceae bacterium]
MKFNKLFLLGFVLSYIPMHVTASIRINEVMPCNFSTYMDRDYFNFSGYIEFYNDSEDTISLRDYTLSHYKQKKSGKYSKKWIWTVDKDVVIPAHSYQIVWMDEMTMVNHCPYKLDADGGYVTLSIDSQLIDSISYQKMLPRIAYGRYEAQEGYMLPSPEKENTVAYGVLNDSTRAAQPLADVTSGIKTEPFYLTLSSESEHADIYYTLNGTEPSIANGLIYSTPIYVAENMNLRVIAYEEGKLPSEISSFTYIFHDEAHDNCGGYTIPVVSITVDSLYFYDDSLGICVKGVNGKLGEKECTRSKANYNRDWKRPVVFSYFVDGEEVLSQEVEASVEGGCSRKETVKSLALKASKKTGQDEFKYVFFQSKPDIVHQTLYLRNGGTAYGKVRFRDGLMQAFAIGMNIDYQAFQPVAYYINGKYIGIMNLNERTNVDYLKANYGIDEEDVDLITISDQLGIRASKGDKVAYDELVSYLSNTDPSDSIFFEGACERMDMDEYMDYQVFQQFIVNSDWPGNNTKMWRERKEGAKFRWILFDTDFGLGLPGYANLGNYTKNMFNWCQGIGGKQWANSASWMTKIFAQLSKNHEFREKLVDKFLYHLSTTFSDENIEAVFDSMTTIMDAEYCAHYGKTATSAASSMKTFALKRSSYIIDQSELYLGRTDVNDNESIPLSLMYWNEESFSLITERPIVQVAIYSVNGMMLSERSVGDTYFEQDMSDYPKGVYLLSVTFENCRVTRKIMKE